MRARPAALVSAVLALALVITGCSSAPTPEPAAEGSITERYGLTGMDARQVIDTLDTTALDERPQGLQASIRPDEVILVDESGEDLRMPMPEDEVYVAFAPYVAQTHDCTFHAPNSCVGEMRNADLSVSVVDAESGEVYVDGDATTYDNGFIGYWLPRDVDAVITVTADGQTGSVQVTTRGSEAPTCITTLQLS